MTGDVPEILIKIIREAGQLGNSRSESRIYIYIHKRYLTECEQRVSEAASCYRLILMKIICINLTTLGPMY